MTAVIARLCSALTTLPGAADWRRVLIETPWLAPVLAALGWMGGLVDTSTPVVAVAKAA
jgi:hypothetical protein